MSVLLLKFAPYIAAVLLVFSAGTYAGYRLNPWQARYHALQLTDADARAQGEQAVRKALESQLVQAQAVSTNNAQVIHDLQNQNAAIAAARDHTADLVRRLLHSQAQRTASSGAVPQAPNQPGTPATGPPSGDGPISELLVNAATECSSNSAQLDSLIAEIKPQVLP
jgi:hypothetical protein